MTNKDILEQICHDCYNRGDCGFRSRGLTDKCQRIDATEYALEVKDQQFKEFLEEKLKEKGIDLEPASDILEEIINELFKED